ncbi:hypothetical protein [uncultured Alsobacter sp.]|uniref:hypothetical protein n=1 Tax=uncultured Alsobacter sp. TaxID=1748258 RepID=UPI0025E199BD|nr:hypothetical protein [uncultured Alsobacter sp.]
MLRKRIDEQNEYLLRQQRHLRIAADVVAEALAEFEEVEAVAVVGSVAKPLWKEVPRFAGFRQKRIELWHECFSVDLAVWLDHQHRLAQLRQASNKVLREAYEAGKGISVANHQVNMLLFPAGSSAFAGVLCHYKECPRGKIDCRAPGCGTVPYNRVVMNFVQRPSLLEGVEEAMLYRRGVGRLRSALELPVPEEEPAAPPKRLRKTPESLAS